MRFGEEHGELRTAVRLLLSRYEGAAAWEPLTRQIGVAGLAVPEEYGGAGCGPIEVHVVMEELGRALSPVPYLGSAVLATQALLAAGDTELLPALADGRTTGALAWAESGAWRPEAVRARAVRDAGAGGSPASRTMSWTGLMPTSCWSWPAPRPGSHCSTYRPGPAASAVRRTPRWT